MRVIDHHIDTASQVCPSKTSPVPSSRYPTDHTSRLTGVAMASQRTGKVISVSVIILYPRRDFDDAKILIRPPCPGTCRALTSLSTPATRLVSHAHFQLDTESSSPTLIPRSSCNESTIHRDLNIPFTTRNPRLQHPSPRWELHIPQ
jgi:hypothetical protein